MRAQVTDAILLQATLAHPRDLRRACQALCDSSDWGLTPGTLAWSESMGRLYAYAPLTQALDLTSSDMRGVTLAFEKILQQTQGLPISCSASRLERRFRTAGRSAGAVAQFHYVVETDPEHGWADEIARWYDEEHMPGLAAVEGCVLAQRFRNHDAGPLSLACYDLTTADALGSPAWLAVRATPWSAKARPHFTNTLRTMFQLLPG